MSSRCTGMADIDVDHRSSTFPKALFNGHLTTSNSDARAGDNLDRHDDRWEGLNGWWREVFGFSLASGEEALKETPRAGSVPLNPRVKSDSGVDATAHDFLKCWIVDKQPNDAIAYFSRRSYPCLETIARKNQKPIPPEMVRVRVKISMEKFNAKMGTVTSVGDAFEAASNWSPELKEAKNAYPSEFRLVSVPPDMGRDEECFPVPEAEDGKTTKEKYYATAFRGKQGDSRNQIISLLWAEEGKYWKIVAIHIEDSSDAGLTPGTTATTRKPPVSEAAPQKITGDPSAVKSITSFYELWLAKRDTAAAAHYASERAYPCLSVPSGAEGELQIAILLLQFAI
jgi:hypothetical protein